MLLSFVKISSFIGIICLGIIGGRAKRENWGTGRTARAVLLIIAPAIASTALLTLFY